MTTAAGSVLAAGFQRAVVFELDSNGYPAAPGTTAYEGLEIIAPKVFNMSNPDVTKIAHIGQDRVLATQFLPPREGATAQLTMDGSDTELIALLTGVEEYTLVEKTFVSWATNKQGSEPNIGMLLVQAALDATNKLGRRHFYIVPSGRAIPKPNSFNENSAEMVIDVAINPSTKHLWGAALADNVEGATEAAWDEGDAEGAINIVAFKGNNSNTVFLLPTDKPATSTAKMKVWSNGAPVSPTLSTTQLTFSPAPGTGAIVFCMYEY